VRDVTTVETLVIWLENVDNQTPTTKVVATTIFAVTIAVVLVTLQETATTMVVIDAIIVEILDT